MKRILIYILLVSAANIHAQWERIPTTTNLSVTKIKIIDKNIFAVTSSTKDSLFVSSNEGNTWEYIDLGNPITKINSLVQKANFIFAASDSGIFRSPDYGLSWIRTNEGLPDAKYVYSLAVIDSTIYAVTAYQRLYNSTNNGEYWQLTAFPSPAYCIDSNGKDIFVGTYGKYVAPNDGIFISSDSEIPWLPINSGLPGTYVRALAFYNSKLFSGIYSYIAESNSGPILKGEGVYISSDKGIKWEQSNNGLNNLQIIEFLKTKESIFATTEGNGLYFYKGETDKWISVSDNLPYSSLYSIATNDTELFVGTNNGIFKRPITEIITSVKQTELPTNFSLSQNYPNSFNPSTTIKYSIPSVGREGFSTNHVTLKVYDMLGREIQSLVNEEKAPGNYEVSFNGKGLASGVYFYRLQSEQFSETKKFVLMK